MMNGQNPSNSNNSNIPNTPNTPSVPEGLDPTVLGSVQPVDSLEPVTPPEVAQAPNMDVQTPVQPPLAPNNNPGGYVATHGSAMANQAMPIPGTGGSVPPVGADPINSNAFVEPQKVENVGAVPPPAQPEKKKKPMNKFIFILLIVAIIAGVAYGVYYYLSLGKDNAVSVTPKTLSVGLGEALPSNIVDYATITGTSTSNCTYDVTGVDINTIGSYKFNVKCDDNTYEGVINVADTTPPTVVSKIVYTPVNETVGVDDFIESCEDATNCTTTFADESALTGYLATAGGPYNVDINAVDEVGNSKVVNGVLYVVSYEVRAFNSCSSPAEALSDYSATRSIVDKLAFGSDGASLIYLNAGRREYTYVFTNESQYNEVVGKKDTNITFDNHTGFAIYDDDNLTLIISENLSIETLNSEANDAFPSTFTEVKNYYENTRGYTCQTKTR